MNEDIERILFTEAQIAKKVAYAAARLDEKFKASAAPPLAICVLKGSVFFFCDLVRAMQTPVQPDFITVSSYGDSSQSSGAPKIISDLAVPVDGRDVILVEDIIDTGNTVASVKSLLMERGAKSCTVVALCDKPVRRTAPVKADLSCFEAGDEFIVGYGLDYAQRYRCLPYIGVLKRQIYEKDS